MQTLTKNRAGKYPCPHKSCARHKEPFDTPEELRGHLGWHGRKKAKKQSTRKPRKSATRKPRRSNKSTLTRSTVIAEALRRSPSKELTTADIVEILRQKGFKGSADSLRTAVSTAANASDDIVRLDRGRYRWQGLSAADDVPHASTPGEPENLDVVVAERNRLRATCQRLAEINMSLMSLVIE